MYSQRVTVVYCVPLLQADSTIARESTIAGGRRMAQFSCSTFTRSILASTLSATIVLGFGPAVAHADLTPITFGNGLMATVGGCQSPDVASIVRCTADEVLTDQAPLMLDLNPIGTTIVTLGAGLFDDGSMRPLLVDRLEATLELAQRYPFTHIITSGGVPRAGVTEASAMRNWLVEHGIPAFRITEEGASGSTIENAINTAAILSDRRASGVVVVSSPNHVERALVDFRAAVAGRIPVSGVVSEG